MGPLKLENFYPHYITLVFFGMREKIRSLYGNVEHDTLCHQWAAGEWIHFMSDDNRLVTCQEVLRRWSHHAEGGGHSPDRHADRTERNRFQVQTRKTIVKFGSCLFYNVDVSKEAYWRRWGGGS